MVLPCFQWNESFLGYGVGRDTVLPGFKITGAKSFVTDVEDEESMEFCGCSFFYSDGGGRREVD